MCGIVAWLGVGGAIPASRVASALKTLQHRGPDGTGIWISSRSAVALGHTRLAVLDLESGAQPIANEDSSIHAVVNGEFYDFERLRHDLKSAGHKFRSRSDSEILVHLYEEYGLRCFDYLRGEFAFVLWDQRKQRLLAARDRFGIKPLCWALTHQGIYMASEAKALFALGVPAVWDAVSFMHAACHQYLPPIRTLFSGVSSVEPGCSLLVDLKQAGTIRASDVRSFRYWNLDYPADRSGSEATTPEMVQLVRQQLEAAVRLRMRADVPVACYLSGGIDSAAVVACAAQHSPQPIECFTVGFEGTRYDESVPAAESAAAVGAQLHVVRMTQEEIVDALPEAVWFSEGLAVNGHVAAKYLLSRAVHASGYKVVLTGEGADEALLGYAHLRRDLLLAADAEGTESRLAQLFAENGPSAGILLPKGEALPLDSIRRRLGFVPSFLEAKATMGKRVAALLAPEWRTRFEAWDPFDELLGHFDVKGQLHGRHPVEQSAYLWTRLALPSYVLRMVGDGAEMANSVEGRLPFLDHHFFQAVRDLPLDVKISANIEKPILRQVMRPWFPDSVTSRRKQPFLAPPITHVGGRTRGFVRDMLGSAAFAAVPFFESKRVLRWLDDLEKQPTEAWIAADPALMIVVCSCVLQARFSLAHV